MKAVNIGVVGLGRLGIKHAENLAFKIPKANLIAVCAMEEERLEEVKREWGIPYTYKSFDEMIKNGIEPVMNLYHFDMPAELQEKYGGWESKT